MSKTCPVCGKKMAGKKALAQHREAVHAKSTTVARAPTRARSSRKMVGTVSSGREVLKSVSIRSGTPAGTLLYGIMLGPKHMYRTRIRSESQLWSRWKPTSLRFTIVGSGSATTYGSILVGWVPEPGYRLSQSADSAITQVGAMQVRQICRVNGTVSLTVPTNLTRKWLMTDGTTTDEDEYCHGSFHLIASADIGGFTGKLSVQIELDWTVSWDGQLVSFIDSDPSSANIRPDSGWINIFTTSDGSYDSTILTFKMHSGGDMVPFTEAQDGVVYTTENTNTTVYYYGQDGRNIIAHYFVRIRGYSTPGLALVATREDGMAYYQSGDTSKLLKYYKPGPYVTPVIPQFAPVAHAAGFQVEAGPSYVVNSAQTGLVKHDDGERMPCYMAAIISRLDAISARIDMVENSLFRDVPGSESGSFENINV